MSTISVRDKSGETVEKIRRLKKSQKEGNPYKERSDSYIVLEILNLNVCIDALIEKYC